MEEEEGVKDVAGRRGHPSERRRPSSSSTDPEMMIIQIVAAWYRPQEGRRMSTPTATSTSSEVDSTLLQARDVTHFVLALLLAQAKLESPPGVHGDQRHRSDTRMEEVNGFGDENHGDDDYQENHANTWIRWPALHEESGMKRTQVVLDIHSMNALWGDPCPGTSKRLDLDYNIFLDGGPGLDDAAASAPLHQDSFAEHERVVLRVHRRPVGVLFPEDETSSHRPGHTYDTRRIGHYDDDLNISHHDQPLDYEDLKKENNVQSPTIRAKRRKRETTFPIPSLPRSTIATSSPASAQRQGRMPLTGPYPITTTWSLRSATSEIVLPIAMSFLDFRERIHCRLVCRAWCNIIQDWGVAKTIDHHDPAFSSFTVPFFRGLLSQSYSSLQNLFLSGFQDLQKTDLHPALPFLRNLRSLDLSWCNHLDDSTLELIASTVHETLEVLYIKDLRQVTDLGVSMIARSCGKLRVLDISCIRLTDQSGVEIGTKLTKLRALYMRDNYLLTNESVDIITQNCTRLEQLTLWGLNRLRHLSFDPPASSRLVMLNLLGCYQLRDDAAESFARMDNLRSLIVSECHGITDRFVIVLAQSVPRLNHLQLRFCKRLTDAAVYAIGQHMPELYSLDLSSCSCITISSISSLLEILGKSLAELKIAECRHLDIVQSERSSDGSQESPTQAGQQILNAIRVHGPSCSLSVLDVRHCGRTLGGCPSYSDSDPFVQSMATLRFRQHITGYFVRPAVWNSELERRLVERLVQ